MDDKTREKIERFRETYDQNRKPSKEKSKKSKEEKENVTRLLRLAKLKVHEARIGEVSWIDPPLQQAEELIQQAIELL